MRKAVVALAALALAVGGLVAPAEAAQRSFEDPRGDAPPRHDLRRVFIANETDWVRMRLRVRDLRGGSRAQVAGLLIASGPANADFSALTVRRGDGSVVTRVTRYGGGPAEPVRCRKASRWLLGTDLVTMRFHQNCLGASGPILASAAIGWGNGTSGDPSDWTRAVVVRYG